MNDLLIRKLDFENDIDAIIDIHTAVTKNENLDDLYRLLGEQTRRCENVSLAAEVEGKVVGYMISFTIFSGFGLSKSAWITMMEVNPELMGQGIGKKLGMEIFKIYKELDVDNIYSSVPWDSTDLLSFFKTLGFKRSNFINLTRQI